MFRTNSLNHAQSKGPSLSYFLTLLVASILAVLVSASFARGAAQDIQKLNRLVQASNSSDASAKAFRDIRELIDKKKWVEAAESCGKFINDYPDDKNVDAAFYWQAYAFVKMRKFSEAKEVLERLISEFPKSAWVKDAKMLLIQITKDPDISIDDEELKIIALQSLFQSNSANAIPIATEWLKPGSKRSEEAQEAAINLLGQYGGAQGATILADVARNHPNKELREAAMRWIVRRGSIEEIIKIYEAERDEDVKEVILHRLAERWKDPAAQTKLMQIAKSDPSTELRESAIHRIAERSGPQAVDFLIQLYDAERNEDVKESLLHRLAERSQNPAAMEKLMQVAKSDSNNELRESAIHRIAERSGAQATAFLIQIYDADRNEDIRESILHRLAERWQDPAAQAKLMDVAKNDPNTEMRESAIHRIAERSGVDYVIQLYDTERNREIKESLLHRIAEKARSQRASAQTQDAAMKKLMEVAKNDSDRELRESAIHRIAEIRRPDTLTVLFQLYETEKDTEVRESVVHRISERQEPEALAKLIEIARNEKNEDLRQSAIHRLSERRGGQGVDALIQFYDTEKSEEVKESILHRLGEAARNPVPGDSPQKRALRKLMQVAKSDPSIELRKRAIHLLGESKDPEAAKFIEEILK